MPIELQPVVRPRYGGTSGGSGVFTSGDWSWVAQQEYQPERAWTQIGSRNRRGTIKGGPTYTRLLQLGNEEQWAVVPPRPALNEGVLDDEKDFYRRQLGALDLNLADPITTMRSLADQAGMATGEDQNPLAWLRGVDAFLQGKDIDPFGMEDTGAPARAADYALALPILVWNKLAGRNDFMRDPTGVADFSHRFQADPRYWAILANPETTREDLDHIARSMVGQFADPDRNSYLVEQIRKQFDLDKLQSEALSSGNDAIDYTAIKATYARATGIPFFKGQGWTPIPVIGTQIASSIDPISQAEREWWSSLTVNERATALQDAGMQQMAKDFIGSVPALSGLGTVLMVAKAGQLGTAGRALYQTYDWGFRGANVVMTTGLVVATTNWALEAAWPGYEDAIGREIDLARPISGSNLAGAVNAMGYWATGTYGAANAVKLGTRVVRATTGKGLPVIARIHPSPIGGVGPEHELYRTGHGGARMAGRLVSEGLDPQGLALSQKRLTMSYVSHLVGRHDEEMFSAIVEGQPTGVDAIDELPLNERIDFANSYMARSVDERAARTEMAFRILNTAKQEDAVFKSLDDIRARDWARKNARTIEHLSAGAYLSEYGPAWVYRTTGGNDAASIERWVRDSFERMGLDPNKIKGGRSQEQWEQTLRAVYHYEFDRNVGLMHAAIDAMPTNEAKQISLVSARHVFKDEVEDLVAVLRGEDEEAARELVVRLIRDKIEVEQWYTRHWQPPRKSQLSPELVDPKVLANHLEQISPALPGRRGNPDVDPVAASLPLNTFHRGLKEDGLWEIAFKPTDEQGNFVSYIRTSDGASFRSPWLDYPMTSTDMVELGNAGLLRSKWDGVFRGFRTYRISEYQRGSLFRNLTGRFAFTASQIDEFHDQVIKAAREFSVQPQTLGTTGKLNVAGIGSGFKNELDRIAERTFGQGPYVDRQGNPQEIDWLDVVAKSYRQSLKLNLTAGLTSHMKSRLGSIGNAAAWASDIAYVNIRFNLSPIFKWSEFVESLGFGAMRGNARGDPWTEALFYRYGLGNDFGIVSAEKTYDQMLAGMNEVGRGGQRVELTPAQRQAKGYMWYARNLPEDFTDEAERVFAQGEGIEFADAHGGGASILPSYPRAEGARAGFDLPEGFTLDPIEAGVPADRLELEGLGEAGFWHTTTNLDAVMQEGLFSRAELASRTADSRIRDEILTEIDELGEQMNAIENTLTQVPDDDMLRLNEQFWALRHKQDALRNRLQHLDEPPVGLGNLTIDRNVSLTISEFHADAIAERLRLAVRAARNEADVDEIVDHFTGPGSPYDLDTATVMSTNVDGTGTYTEWEPFLAELRMRYTSGRLKYSLVQQLDRGLHRLASSDDGPWSGAIGLVADEDAIARIDPRRIGTVRVGVRAAPAGPPGVIKKEGPDVFEYQFDSADVFVIDDRPNFPIAHGDKEKLLKQLRSTLTERPQPSQAERLENELAEIVSDTGEFAPGMEARGQEILEELGRIDRLNEQPSADRMEDVFGTPEHLSSLVEERTLQLIPSWRSKLAKEGRTKRDVVNALLPNPIPFKERAASRAQIDIMRREFPSLLRAAGMDGPIEVLNDLQIPEREWAAFLLRDRELLQAAQVSNHPDDWQALFDWAPGAVPRETPPQGSTTFYRGHDPAATAAGKRILTGDDWWDNHLFVTTERRYASDYGPEVGEVTLVPGAKILREGTPEFTAIEATVYKSMMDWASATAKAAELDGWDAVQFARQGDIGTIILNREAIWRPPGTSREALNALYASEEWAVITSLWSIASRTASDDAFRVHFFNPYRSAFERSINHPLLGVYPASWAYKAAREWIKFLFDNDTIHGLHLGMTPVVAINNLVDAQNQAFAQANPEMLEYYVNRRGPFGSTLFIANLLLPGDWSSIPFPLSRSIRDVLRGNTDPGYILSQQVGGMGIMRDQRLITEMLGEVQDYAFGPDGNSEDNPWTPRSENRLYSEPRR